MAGSEFYMIRVEGDSIIWVDTTGREQKEIGITLKAYKAVEEALSDVIAQRDEYYEMLVKANIIERKKDPSEIAKEALEEAKQARLENHKISQQLADCSLLIEKLLNKDNKSEIVGIEYNVTESNKETKKDTGEGGKYDYRAV